MDSKHLRWIALGLFVIANFLPAFFVEAGSDMKSVLGAYCLIAGWMMALGGGIGLTWLANLFVLVSVFLSKSKLKWKMALSILAILSSLFFMRFERSMIDSSGKLYDIVSYSFGYYLWVTSLFIYMIYLIFQIRNADLN